MIVADTWRSRDAAAAALIVQIALSLALFVASHLFRAQLFLPREARHHGYDVGPPGDGPGCVWTDLDTPTRRAGFATSAQVRERLDRDGRIAGTALAGELTQMRNIPGTQVARGPSDTVTTNSGVWLPRPRRLIDELAPANGTPAGGERRVFPPAWHVGHPRAQLRTARRREWPTRRGGQPASGDRAVGNGEPDRAHVASRSRRTGVHRGWHRERCTRRGRRL